MLPNHSAQTVNNSLGRSGSYQCASTDTGSAGVRGCPRGLGIDRSRLSALVRLRRLRLSWVGDQPAAGRTLRQLGMSLGILCAVLSGWLLEAARPSEEMRKQ